MWQLTQPLQTSIDMTSRSPIISQSHRYYDLLSLDKGILIGKCSITVSRWRPSPLNYTTIPPCSSQFDILASPQRIVKPLFRQSYPVEIAGRQDGIQNPCPNLRSRTVSVTTGTERWFNTLPEEQSLRAMSGPLAVLRLSGVIEHQAQVYALVRAWDS